MKLTKTAWAVMIGLGVAGSFFGYREADSRGWIPSKPVAESVERGAVELPEAVDAPVLQVAQVVLPSVELAKLSGPEMRFEIWAWNAQMGCLFANGGAVTTEGSLMAKSGVNLHFTRQDNVEKNQAALIAFANELSKGNPHPESGAHFVAIMGDGAANFLNGVNSVLTRLGREYTAEVIGSCGYSRGEDKFMGPSEWKSNPNAARGGVVSGYLRDGDWNIALKWSRDNGICNNPDETTWNPDCLNWIAAADYLDAAKKYIAGYCEDRPVVRKGKKTGETKHVCTDAVVTWTPGDVNVAHEKGGLVSIVSTKEYSGQMPNTIIGIRKWNEANRDRVEKMLEAFFDGADQVRSSPEALMQAAAISAKVYNEADPEYWAKYYRGVVETDKQGLQVELGGSKVNNLADNLYLFGLMPGSGNTFAATYTTFAKIVAEEYPDLLPSYPKAEEILNTSYIQAIANRRGGAQSLVAMVEKPAFREGAKIEKRVSQRSWHIMFKTGSAEFTPAARNELQDLLNQLLIAESLAVEIHGHTDNVGSSELNMKLSKDRARAVKAWLEANAPANLAGHITDRAWGQTSPVATNETEEGRAQNRRVEVVLGTTG